MLTDLEYFKKSCILMMKFPFLVHQSLYLQTEKGIVVPPVLRKYMDGLDFLPFVKDKPTEVPKDATF